MAYEMCRQWMFILAHTKRAESCLPFRFCVLQIFWSRTSADQTRAYSVASVTTYNTSTAGHRHKFMMPQSQNRAIVYRVARRLFTYPHTSLDSSIVQASQCNV